MALTPEDRVRLTDLIALHGHVVDDGELERFEELFTHDVVYDLTDFGREPLHGVEAVRRASLALGAANPVAHHVTNIVLTEDADGTLHARSKGIGVYADGTAGSVTYEDTFAHGPHGWRIRYRKVLARRAPLGASD